MQLPGGFRLLVGRDLEERERLHDIILGAGRWSIALVVVLGIAGGFFVTRRVLKRVDAMTGTTQTIMSGDLSGRLPIAGTNDELDRLAGNLNVMLERIEALMRGLKEVTDNIAHDLKTPLTRLRNRAEEALRTAEDESQYRAALEQDDRGIGRADPHLQRAADDRARGIGAGARRHDRVRRRRDRARRRRAVRAARRRQGADAAGRGARLRARCAAIASWSARRSPTWSTTPSNMPRRRRNARAVGGAGRAGQRRAARNRGEGGGRGRPHPADRRRYRARHSRGRPRPRGRALRAAGAEPLAAGLRAGPEPRQCGRAPARRRVAAGGQPARAAVRAGAARAASLRRAPPRRLPLPRPPLTAVVRSDWRTRIP